MVADDARLHLHGVAVELQRCPPLLPAVQQRMTDWELLRTRRGEVLLVRDCLKATAADGRLRRMSIQEPAWPAPLWSVLGDLEEESR
jgi:hypothetical protein